MKIEDLMSIYPDDLLRSIYYNEFLPWLESGILQNGKLRDIMTGFNSIKGNNAITLIIMERVFILECAKRFAKGL